MQRFTNSGLRYIFSIRNDEHIPPFRNKLSWLSNDSRRLYFPGILLYKILRFKQPSYLVNLFTKHIPKDNARGQLRFRELFLPSLKKIKTMKIAEHYRFKNKVSIFRTLSLIIFDKFLQLKSLKIHSTSIDSQQELIHTHNSHSYLYLYN